MKKIKYILLFILLLPTFVFAISEDYKDEAADILSIEKEENKINLYLFHSRDCSHCAAEVKWLEEIKEEYQDYLNVYEYEVTYDEENFTLMMNVTEKMGIPNQTVPITIIGDKYYIGYSDTTSSLIESTIKEYAELDHNPNEVKIPILGNINMKKVSIPIVAIILGFIDGFNPCAMWILLFLINMFFGMKDRKKAWILGLTFLFVSGFVYFLSMLGINFVILQPLTG